MTGDRQDDWGPWVEHDGQGCPVPRGTLGEAELRNGTVVPFRALCGSVIGGPERPASRRAGSAWIWGSGPYWRLEVVAYRVRRPRGMAILREVVEVLPAPDPVRDLEDAPR